METQRKYLLIVTYGRSASTLLQAVVNTCPNACIRGENANVLVGLFRAVVRARQAKDQHGRNRQPPSHPWYGADGIDEPAFSKALAQGFVDHILRPPEDARLIGFKEIRYTELGRIEFFEFLEFVRSVFSPLKILFNMRNLDDVARSGWWKKQRPEKVKAILGEMDSRFVEYARREPETARCIAYESLISDFDYMRGLFQFLGEPLDEGEVRNVLGTRLSH